MDARRNTSFLTNEIAAVKFLQDISGFGPVRFRQVYEEFRSFVKFIDYVNDSRSYPIRSSRTTRLRKILGTKSQLPPTDGFPQARPPHLKSAILSSFEGKNRF